MAILENRVRTTNNFIEILNFLFISIKRFFIVLFILVSLYLLYFSQAKKFSALTFEISGYVISSGVVLYEFIFKNINFVKEKLVYLKDLETENIRLKFEIDRLKKLKSQLRVLTSENIALKDLLKVVEDIKYKKKITAKLLTVSINPISRTAMVSAGENDGVRIDQIVVDHNGLIGRVVGVSDNYSKVMLVNDPESRIPVITSQTFNRGILATNDNYSSILYLNDNHDVRISEQVVTSGDGTIYPPGIVVANVKHTNISTVVVEPTMQLDSTRFVSVYQYN